MFAIESPAAADEDSAPYWRAAHDGELRMQKCGACAHIRFRLPRSVRAAFRGCGLGPVERPRRRLQLDHRARSQYPAFNADVPYNVVIVELAEDRACTATCWTAGFGDSHRHAGRSGVRAGERRRDAAEVQKERVAASCDGDGVAGGVSCADCPSPSALPINRTFQFRQVGSL